MQGENRGTTIQAPYANNPSALEQGRQPFVAMSCAGCHGGHAGGGTGPNPRSPKERRFGDTPAEIFDSISQGRGDGMPAWGTKLPPDVIWQLIAYIQSLGTPEELNRAAPAPTHIGGSETLTGGMLTNDTANLEAWVTPAQSLKPGTPKPNLPE